MKEHGAEFWRRGADAAIRLRQAFYNGGSTGLGALAAHLGLAGSPATVRASSFTQRPQEPIDSLQLPLLHMPFPVRLNVHLDAARRATLRWARTMGLFEPVSGQLGEGLWNERKFERADLSLLAAGLSPDATGAQLELLSQWLTWGLYADDYFPAVFIQRHEMSGSKLFHERLAQFMPPDCGTTPPPLNPVERGLTDLWPRTAQPVAEVDRLELCTAVLEMTGSWLWELASHAENRIPDPIEYVEMRRKTVGSDLLIVLLRLMAGDSLPPQIYKAQPVKRLHNSAVDSSWLINDIYSYRKEIEFEGELMNVILVIRNFLGCHAQAAMAIASGLMEAQIRQFERIMFTELPVFCANFELDTPARAQLDQYVQRLKDFVSAYLHWHKNTGRFCCSPAGQGPLSTHPHQALRRTGLPPPGYHASS